MLKIKDNIVCREIENKYYLVDSKDHFLHSLNETASYIFNCLTKHMSLESIVAAVSEEYDVSILEAKEDLLSLIEALKQRGILFDETDQCQ